MIRLFAFVIMVAGFANQAHADLLTTFEYMEWQSWIEDHSTIDFTGFPDGTPISNQYAGLGVTFTGPSFIFATSGFVNDGWGLHGPSGLHVFFNEPQSWIAIDHGGTAMFKLYSDGKLLGTSGFDPVGGIGSFLGVTSSILFDEIIITTQPVFGPHVGIDDLHWGGPVPAPSALCLLAFSLFHSHKRNRS